MAGGSGSDQESERLRALASYDILDSLPEPAYDDIVTIASEVCDTPLALVSLVDDHRQWFKAAVGLAVKETPRDIAFCSHAIREHDVFIVEDAARDPRFRENPLVTSDPNLRFYAGTQLRSQDGHALGTLCVLDRVARQLRPEQLQALRVLGRQVETQLELRKAIHELALREQALLAARQESDELRAFLVHDLKNALGMMLPNAEFLEEGLEGEERAAASDLRQSAQRMLQMVVTQLAAKQAPPRIVARRDRVDLCALVQEVARQARRRVEEAGRRLEAATAAPAFVHADEQLLRRVLENLIDNAVKYAGPAATRIALEVHADPGADPVVVVSDDGVGIPESDRERIFTAGSRLHPEDTSPASRGLGLAFCRTAIEAHGGKIWASEAKPRGSAFHVRLPTATDSTR